MDQLKWTCKLNTSNVILSNDVDIMNPDDNADLTVLLVNQKNDYNTRIGRYHSVKPLIGLLTSTARTFIQDGVTTEFATQILGTTLDNGRIYAQLLTKSSLVLYNKPSNIDPVIVKPTRVHSVFDGEWNVKQDLGYIDPDKFVLKNTDYIAPSSLSKVETVYASKAHQDDVKFWNTPSAPESQYENQVFEEPTARKIQEFKEIPRYVHNEAINYLDGPVFENEKRLELVVQPSILENVNTLHRQSKAYEAVTESIIEYENKNMPEESSIVKVKPNFDLPTFTIKNEFSPIFYYIDNVETRKFQPQTTQQTKLPKKLFGQKSEPRPKKTFTYEGFADFTTVVGDTVIIFTPNTDISKPQNPGEVNVFPSAKHVDKLATKITFLSADIPVATSTYKAHESNAATTIITKSSSSSSSVEDGRSEKALFNDEESLKKVLYEVDDKVPDSIRVQYDHGFDLNIDVIQPSEAVVTTEESTRLTDNLGVIPIQQYNAQATEPLNTISPSSTILEAPKETAVTERDVTELFTHSEEEVDNTAAEVTEKMEEEEEEEEDVEEEVTTLKMEPEVITTTESGHSEESYEDLDTTTESIPYVTPENYNDEHHDNHEDVVCTSGLETQSTMTTAYKTLTYLTTYFIPLESTETTTSIKSDVVVESNVGYYTNIVCKTNIDIEPTAVVNIDVNYSVHTRYQTPETTIEETVATSPVEIEPVTEPVPKTIKAEVEQEQYTVQQIENSEHSEETSLEFESSQESEELVEEKEQTTTTTTTTTEKATTTTERATTTESHVEMTVNTESTTTTTTEKPVTEAESPEESENEIDVIYKTLYTTYTYFTTFFGDSTSSVASHKSVVTNILTSTIDLTNLDPSLLGAFNQDEIAPTGVGAGRPTDTAINSIIDLVKNKDVIESVEINDKYSSQTPTPSLGDDIIASIKPDAVKTYFTTYTFFTTIYVGSDANVCSRSEVYTNYVGPDELIPTKTNPFAVESSKAQFDFRNCKQVKREPPANPEENSSMTTSVSMEESSIEQDLKDIDDDVTPQPTPIEVDMLFSVESNPLESENSYVTDVKSSSSRGERQYLENNNVLDDQISSESNIDEIIPSPTLLLQTSYTTFTYFTTMYIGKDSSKVKSHLETITNVVTETIMPNKEPEDDSNLPITYYTTFTYWTTLYKDKSTTITSREEIVSNVVTPTVLVQSVPTISPIDTTPIDIDSVLPPKELEVEIKPSLIEDNSEQYDGRATFYTTYTYFTTFYAGNTSQIRSSLETVTNVVENTKLVEDNQIARKVPTGAAENNLIKDGEKSYITPTLVKEVILPTKLPDISSASPTVLLGTYIDNLFAEVKPAEPAPVTEKKILFSQVAVISGDSTIVTSDNKTLTTDPTTSTTTTTTESVSTTNPEVIESSEPETTTEPKYETEEDDGTTRKKSRLTFTPKKPSITPVIIPFSSRNRPTFVPKRVPLLSSATTITRQDFTPTITATPTLKGSVRASAGYSGNRKPVSAFPGSSSAGKRFSGGRSSISLVSGNIPSASRGGSFGRGSIQPTSRRTGFRTSSARSNSLDYISRSAVPRVRPTASSRLQPGRSSIRATASVIYSNDQNEYSETLATQQDETATEPLEEFTESPARTTNNPVFRYRRPPIVRQPGTAIIPRSTTPSARRVANARSRITTTTRRTTTRSTPNPLLSLRRQRPNALFPRRNLFKQPEPEPVEEVIEENDEDEGDILEEGDFEIDNDYDSSDRKERQVSTIAPKKSNVVQIRPFAFRRRTKRQVDYGSRKLPNFRRPGTKFGPTTRKSEPEPETETPATPKQRPGARYNSRLSANSRTTTATAPKKSFIVRGESRTTTIAAPAYRRPKTSNGRQSSRTTTLSARPKAPRLNTRVNSRPSTTRASSSRHRTTTGKTSSRQRSSFESHSGERHRDYNSIVNDGRITITHQIPTEVTIPVVNGKITEYKNVISATYRTETLLLNQVSTSLGPLGSPQLVLAAESTELGDNGATKIIKYLLHETPTTTVIFTPTTIRGRKTSYAHVLPSTVYNVEPVTQTIAPEISSNVPLANLLLSQLLLGNQQPAINPLLALQGQGLLPQQQLPVVQTPITEYKTRATTYVTTVTDSRETVLPITFKGRAILTTISDPTTNVITATEFITDTIVTTPTAAQQLPQFNSLLLPLLLQQQQQQQQQTLLQTANPLLGLGQPDLAALANLNQVQNNLNLNNQNNFNNDIYSNSPKPNIYTDLTSNEDFVEDEQDSEEDGPPPTVSRPKARPRVHKPPPTPPSPPKLTSIVTLYISGRHPGEFSTVLSTVVSEDTQTVRKREAIYYEDVQVSPSLLPTVDELFSSQIDSSSNAVIADTEMFLDNSSVQNEIETQSLESIVGEISRHIKYDASPTYVLNLASPSAISIPQSSVDDVS